MQLSPLTAISPIDGRYYKQTTHLRNIFNEFNLIKFRLYIEIHWLKKLSNTTEIKEIPFFTPKEHYFLNNIIKNFSMQDAKNIKKIEKITQHDIKAIEYFLKEKVDILPNLKKISEFIHFGCTSDDINNLAYGLMLKNTKKIVLLPMWKKIIDEIKKMSVNYKNIPFLSRTHGQPATPSTMGKEMANIAYRLIRQYHQLKSIKILGKMNGAVGNYNAHILAYPKINWRNISREFVTSLGITWNPYTTQIEPHDYIAELSNCIRLFNTILIKFNRDIWGYITLNYFTQNRNNMTIGSSTMPHKTNPIEFENSEGNLGLANTLLNHFSHKLPISRWQRDLSDSTVLRSLGTAIGYGIIAYHNLLKGINKLIINKQHISNELNNNWIILSEAIQIILRKNKIHKSYEHTKKFFDNNTKINSETIKKFIQSLPLPKSEKLRLEKTTPSNYIGLSKEITNDITDIT
ncbi:adenylosuccinate lyase [Candidatus Blochmannia ocreatus (nom. nud.)]|uniref:Adenylosuccinate lyase n=1 Tax=Candidatus Blochmannia ocreatus (nom. nud.) TaxID=251538 RepID=A0ABY4SWI3_9ENTR|nr:adenylosuccinate lyase [Candidatus Blochmannia ocreatus]URJ25423.1 adenylosuccinate lyase [Candidatus Blochmannia ocreatus]